MPHGGVEQRRKKDQHRQNDHGVFYQAGPESPRLGRAPREAGRARGSLGLPFFDFFPLGPDFLVGMVFFLVVHVGNDSA